ncbi:FecCD family ABC transporter permease [Corynebacterium tapiri]|uniref:Iron ABC transporter permease n=1 Tax=Corynebacterium tapiri TaxID=1448266 RepID=A0A5C4U5I7_9CORY|nr:iron ABC transporter permease [Corynebacterium tapiri]TNL98467.1 iron ABC transporter permease [Corynebacterium tapiri]
MTRAGLAGGLVVTLLACTIASVALGVRDISLSDILAALGGSTETASQAAAYVRVPRTVLAALVGASLAIAGACMQAVTRNPLADPGIFGVLSGAALAVVSVLAFTPLTQPWALMSAACFGAGMAAGFVYALGRGAGGLQLALAGAATSAALGSVVSAIALPRSQTLDAFRFWLVGSVGGAQWNVLAIAAPVLLFAGAVAWASARGLNSLALGDAAATALGDSAARVRLISTLAAVVLCGVSTALAGPIAFVGLVVPHVIRLVSGPDHRWLIPLSALGGACLLIAADVVGRLIAQPSEIAVGVITPLIGAPTFIWIVRSKKVRGL